MRMSLFNWLLTTLTTEEPTVGDTVEPEGRVSRSTGQTQE